MAQTHGDWELIVADDGSTDGTADWIRSIEDHRIRVLESPHSGNIAALRNAGVGAGAGEWLAFLDSDDLWVPTRLETQLRQLRREGKRWGYGGFELMDEKMWPTPPKMGAYLPFSGWITREVLTCEASVNIGTLMVQRSLFDELGGFNTMPELICREDYEFVLRLTLHAETTATPELLVRIREHRGRTTSVFDDGNDRTAYVYRHFLRTQGNRTLVRIARRQLAHELTEMAAKRMKRGKYGQAAQQLAGALIRGDRWRHLLWAVRQGFGARGQNLREIIE
jgi:glycosyltransferase involved in cell wall biosynthesis